MRVRLTAPQGESVKLRYLDTMHAAIVNAWTTCGAHRTDVVGRDAANWSFGAVGRATSSGFTMKSLVVGAEGGPLEPILGRLLPEVIRKTSMNGDAVNLSTWDKAIDELPIICGSEGVATLPALMLSPLALSVRGQTGRWHDDLTKAGPDLEEAVNFRLSRLTGREVTLKVAPDRLYLRANPKHSTLVRIRKVDRGKPAFVIGMMSPMVITGRLQDLSSAWSLGIGEKNRYGFGCIGYAGARV